MENKKKIYKIVITGDTGAGKSTLIRNYLSYDIKNISPTIGLEFYTINKSKLYKQSNDCFAFILSVYFPKVKL